MPDYGHDLVFGSFLTPSAKDPQQVVALAQTSERAGLDLVTFQDHPYQPAFLDTWTLLSWVAASTERVQRRRATCSTCRCARPRSSRAPPRASTCSRAVGSRSGSGRERSGTRSSRWAPRGSRPGRA